MMGIANHIKSSRLRSVQQTEWWHFAVAILADDHFMKQGYRIIASERRVLNVVFNDDLGSIQQVLGCTAIEHGTTFHTEDQLLISGDELSAGPIDRFWVAGVPFAFVSGPLVGIDPGTGDTANQPIIMALDEFRRLVTFAASVKGWHRPPVSLVAFGGDDFRGGC